VRELFLELKNFMEIGKFITFEGPEGSGKSTHVKRLTQFLEDQGIDVVATREPGGTALGERIRNMIQHSADEEIPVYRTELLLFLASRAQHVEQLIIPKIKAGSWVLCDRFYDSTMAYQGYGRGLDLQELKRLNSFAVNGLNPDLTILIDVSPETSRKRLAHRHSSGEIKPDRIEKEEAEFHERLRSGFLEMAEQEQDRFYVVNAERDRHVVMEDIRSFITNRFFSPPTP